jgi:hypothetical protein
MGEGEGSHRTTSRGKCVKEPFGLRVQMLPINQGLLVVCDLAAHRSETGWFAIDEVEQLYGALRVPRPVHVERSLGQLEHNRLVLRNMVDGSPRWSLTPAGQERIRATVDKLDYEGIAAELASLTGTDFAQQRHSLIPHAFAPPRWSAGIARLLQRYPFNENVFLMTRFPDLGGSQNDPVTTVVPALRSALQSHGLALHLASDQQIEDEVWGNVGAYMWACRYGVGILEARGTRSRELNDNVLIELGSMLTIGRRCMILRDHDAPYPPTDFVGQIYKAVEIGEPDTVAEAAHAWAARDLGLGRCYDCPSEAVSQS